LFGVVTDHELGEHALERIARQQRAQICDGVVSDDPPFVEHDYPVADALDDFQDVGAVENRLAAGGQRAHEMPQHQRGRDVEARLGLVEEHEGRVVHERAGDDDLLPHPL
jgi:hypothetical protein